MQGYKLRRRKNIQPETRLDCNITDAEAGDYCYYVDISNKVRFAKIEKTFKENNTFCLQVMCQVDFKFHSLPYYYCSFDEKALKGKKRHQLTHQAKER